MILDAFNLKDKVAIVTGCATGLGRGMAIGLAEAGADIAGVYNKSEPTCAGEIKKPGRKFIGIKADLADLDQLEPIERQTVQACGRVDILVNNAGIIRRQPALEFSRENWDEVLNINLRSLFFLAQAVARQFIAQKSGGKIINIAARIAGMPADPLALHFPTSADGPAGILFVDAVIRSSSNNSSWEKVFD
jgi:2-deoxy-D-gluconate 3-dehydrogenase